MSKLQAALDEYLAVHHALGYKLRLCGRLLQRFVDFAEQQGAAHITTDLALTWATQPAAAQPAQWANRLGMVRRFAVYCNASDARNTIPPADLLPYRYRRPDPYIYRDEEIARLLEAAGRLPSDTGLKPHTFVTLFGLYVVTGMRANEALRLDRDDVDLLGGVLTIRETKFGKSRYVPLHPTTQRAMQRYAARRDQCCHDLETPSFFVSDRGTRLTEWCVRWTFVRLSREIGLRGADDSRGPRLHDLRHRLAIATLLGWYQRGVDVERQMPQLSAYLGHAHVTDTYWYLTATPQLLHFALRHVERSRQGRRS